MKIMICIDHDCGISFGGKRQSRDSELINRILAISRGCILRMNGYSATLFKKADNIIISEDFLDIADPEDYCYVENTTLCLNNAEKVYIFNWNRRYPASDYFNKDALAEKFKLVKKEEFKGSSHKKITLEIYEKR